MAEEQPEEVATPQAEEMTLQVQPPSTGETVAAAPPKRIRKKRTVKPAAATESDSAVAAVTGPAIPASEASEADVAASEQRGLEQSGTEQPGTIPEQAHNG